MKKYIFLFVLFLGSSFFTLCVAQNIVQGEFTINGTNNDGANAMTKCADDGYIIIGFTYSNNPNNADVYVMKLDSLFHLQWTKTIGGNGNESGSSIVQTKDRGFAITGVTYSFGDTVNGDVYVIKLDSTGLLQWTKTIGGPNQDAGRSIIQTKDGGYAITGETTSYGFGNSNVYVIKLDSAGNLKWTRTIGGIISEVGYSIIQSKDGGYAITGISQSFSPGNESIYLVKLDSAGSLKWTKTIGGTVADAGYSIIQTAEGGYAITGSTESYGIGVQDVYVVKVDSGGNLQWAKTIGDSLGNDAGYCIMQTKDKGYAIAALTDYYNIGNREGYVIKLDSAGNLKWSRIPGASGTIEYNAIVQSKDRGYVAAGSTSTDIFIAKFDSSGNICDTAGGRKYENTGGIITTSDSGRVSSGGSITSSDSGRVNSGGTLTIICTPASISNIENRVNEINIYPNPCTNTLNVDLGIPSIIQHSAFNICVSDITGRVLLTSSLPLPPYPKSLDVSMLVPGMYFIRINSGGGTEVKKFIKE